jgi:predicted phosphoribosyltransferase
MYLNRQCHRIMEVNVMAKYADRRAAGRKLAGNLESYADRDDVVVLALPRGGVPVGYEVARDLGAPLDVFIVRKLGVPGQPELAMGAIASGGVRVLNRHVVNQLRITDEQMGRVERMEREELQRREQLYRHGREAVDPTGKVALLVDDGLATGASMRAAVQALRQKDPARIVVAVPVAAEDTCHSLREMTDETICAMTPSPFMAVGMWYEDFRQTTDDEVRELLDKANEQMEASTS